jgi:hypothetical protein
MFSRFVGLDLRMESAVLEINDSQEINADGYVEFICSRRMSAMRISFVGQKNRAWEDEQPHREITNLGQSRGLGLTA